MSDYLDFNLEIYLAMRREMNSFNMILVTVKLLSINSTKSFRTVHKISVIEFIS